MRMGRVPGFAGTGPLPLGRLLRREFRVCWHLTGQRCLERNGSADGGPFSVRGNLKFSTQFMNSLTHPAKSKLFAGLGKFETLQPFARNPDTMIPDLQHDGLLLMRQAQSGGARLGVLINIRETFLGNAE